MHLVWGGQNYTPDPMGFDLDPIETTQYEVGLSYQFIADAALDMTAFAKNTTGQIVIAKRDEIKRAIKLTFNDKKIISYNEESALNINFKAFKIISIIFMFFIII